MSFSYDDERGCVRERQEDGENGERLESGEKQKNKSRRKTVTEIPSSEVPLIVESPLDLPPTSSLLLPNEG